MTKEINNELLKLTTGNSGCTNCYLDKIGKPKCLELTDDACLKQMDKNWKLKKK